MNKKTIAIDFDGVIHKYSKGWNDGTVYDEPVKDALKAIERLTYYYNVFILSSRNSNQIKKWIDSYIYCDEMIGFEITTFKNFSFTCEKIPFWKKRWDKKGVLGITNKKLPAHIYIDDRAYHFKNWSLKEISKIEELIK